jgi:hypothetical protein
MGLNFLLTKITQKYLNILNESNYSQVVHCDNDDRRLWGCRASNHK